MIRAHFIAKSASKITYLVSRLTLKDDDDCLDLDTTGEIFYNQGGLDYYLRDGLQVVKDDDFVDLTDDDVKRLVRLLENPDVKITAQVYASDDDVDCSEDMLSDCQGYVEISLSKERLYCKEFSFEAEII